MPTQYAVQGIIHDIKLGEFVVCNVEECNNLSLCSTVSIASLRLQLALITLFPPHLCGTYYNGMYARIYISYIYIYKL